MEDFDLDTESEMDVEETFDSGDCVLNELEDIDVSGIDDDFEIDITGSEYELPQDYLEEFADNTDDDFEVDITGPEYELPQDYLEEIIDNADDKESLSRLKDLLESGKLGVETDDIDEEDTEKILSLGSWRR